jgi:hypothetical protein
LIQVAATDVFFLSNEFSAYEKFARWQARTGNPFIDYFTVLDIGMRWEKRSYGNLSFAECVYAFNFLLLNTLTFHLALEKNIQKKLNIIQICATPSLTLSTTTQDLQQVLEQ